MKKKKIAITVIFLVALFLAIGPVFCEYAELNGKYVELHGPYCWDKLGVARDEVACDTMIKILAKGNKAKFFEILESYRILRVAKNTKAMVLEIKLDEGKAKVLILSGLHRGFSGWVPIAWLKGNEKRPLIPEYHG
ncbi:MAG: hypothetical protein PHQ96_02910 [Candidatus Omnitrophica bacterium]|nr:hypothetical protein [Candidatus Omnitrophota bacterium]